MANSDASGNKQATDASGNKQATDASGNKQATDASGNKQATDASGNKPVTTVVNDNSFQIDLNTSIQQAFSQSNVIFLIWFLVFYFILYFLINLFSKPSNSETVASGNTGIGNTVDIIFFLILFIYVGSLFLTSTPKQNQDRLTTLGTSTKTYMEDPYSILSLFLFILVFYLAIYLIGISMGKNSKPVSIWLFENGLILMFILLLICNFFKYLLNVDLVQIVSDTITKWWSGTTTTTDISNNIPRVSTATNPSCKSQKDEKIPGAEVFNISNNLYTYDDAQSICKAYGARLANYDDIEDSYKNGGEWCNYGWSANQMAFFPTQKASWEKLQETPGHKNDCGRPGVNGGYFANPDIRFGVNCYGKKPKPSSTELSMMDYNKQNQFAKTPQERAIDEKVKYWQDNASTLLNLNSFNDKQWSSTN